ncbi:MAG: molybdopterin-dependent oxidoreductase [Halioglobus sp.]
MTTATQKGIKTACNLCFVNCGLEVDLGGENGREIIKVRGDKDHPTSKGYICNKAARINFYQNNRDRLHTPMRKRDDGTYEPIDWDTAINEIATKLGNIRDTHGGERIFYYGGGAQGDHLGGAYAPPMRAALGMKYKGNAISQEKTGLAWVFSRMVGSPIQSDVHHASVAMFVGKNPFMSNGIDKARELLREMSKDPTRKLIVVDPRRTETADYADIHLAVKPGRDAWCMAAIVGYLVQHDLLPMTWLAEHTHGYEKVIAAFKHIPVDEFAHFAGITPELIAETAQTIAQAESFALEEDLGIQMAPHSTLVTYLNFLLSLMTGNYGKPGTMDAVTQLAPIIAVDHTKVDEQGYEISRKTLPVTGARIVSGLYPGAFLAEEILNDHPERPRGIVFESSNPVHSLPQSQLLRDAIRSLECSVAIDVAMTETARECDYVLPAATNFEKWSATFFPRNFPANIFHLRPPVMDTAPGVLIEPEIHARLIEALDIFEPDELAPLHAAAANGLDAYKDAFFEQMGANPKVGRMLSYVLYRTLGPTLGKGREATSAVWGLCQVYVMKHPQEAERAGYVGENAGTDLFNAITSSPSGTFIGESRHADSFANIPHPDNKLQLVIGELLDELGTLADQQPLLDTSEEFPFSLIAGSRRAYTANCAIRDPEWVKGRNATALTLHPEDASRLNIPEGARVLLETQGGEAEAEIAFDERLHQGTLSIPNGQGMDFSNENGEKKPFGIFANELTTAKHRDKFIGTPLHKFVPARISLLAS